MYIHIYNIYTHTHPPQGNAVQAPRTAPGPLGRGDGPHSAGGPRLGPADGPT